MSIDYRSRVIHRKNYWIPIFLLILLILSLGVRIGLNPSNKNVAKGSSVEAVKEGQAFLKKEKARKVSDVESEIDKVEQRRRASLIKRGDLNTIFSNSMIMGDSHMEGISIYRLVDSSRVAAVKGRSLANCQEEIKKTINMSPSIIFMNYGMNDAMHYGSDVDAFINKYSEVISQLQESLPNSKIVICSIFLAQPEVYGKKPALANIPKYNEKLADMCKKRSLAYIDTTKLMTPDIYEPDHIHTNIGFHKLWLGYVATQAGLI